MFAAPLAIGLQWCGGFFSFSPVVGYQANAVAKGYAMVTPTFVNISGKDMPIDSVILNNVEDTMATVQVVNEDGSWGANGVWFNAYEDLPAGWFTDMSGTTSADITLKPGQSVFVKVTATGAKAKIPSALK